MKTSKTRNKVHIKQQSYKKSDNIFKFKDTSIRKCQKYKKKLINTIKY